MFVIDWISFSLGFATAAVFYYIVQLVMALIARKNVKQEQKELSKKITDFKEEYKAGSASSGKRSESK
jgi:dipeptide/tripeptide permease